MARGERLLPEYDVESRHAIRIAASAARVYETARGLDLSRSRLTAVLFRLRGLPGSGLTLDGLERAGFRVLDASPPRGFAYGIVGRFWTPSGGLVDLEPEEFPAFDEPGYAKAVWSFEFREDPYGVTFAETVTRVRCTDDAARRRFRRYWRLVGPFSGLIRGQTLRLLRAASESTR